MGRKDVITKEYMEDTEVFADVFNHMIYKGEKVIDPKNLKELDTANVICELPKKSPLNKF